MGMHEKLLNGEATMSVVGLGYVGLPIALAFAKHIKVIGFDINEERVEMMRNRIDPSEELEASDDGCDITFTANRRFEAGTVSRRSLPPQSTKATNPI